MTFELNVVREGADWVGRATGSGADVELRFRDGGAAPLGHRVFSGTIGGQARDAGIRGLLDPRDVSVMIGAGTAIEGQTAFTTTASTLVGRARGDFRFADSAGNTSRCAVVGIHINAPSN